MVLMVKIGLSVVYLFMITMNFLANSLPFYGRTTGEISSKYPTLFTPAGFTFSIWGIIYLSLAVLTVRIWFYDASFFTVRSHQVFIIMIFLVSLFNVMWLVFWHQEAMIMSLIVITLMLATLIIAYQVMPNDTIIRTTISLYLGWISVATIANAAIALVSLEVNMLLPDSFYLFIVLLTAIALAVVMVIKHRDFVFLAVIIWAIIGIFSRGNTP